jgi:outer membrane protein OmpA-like peptidoglycan-associated protein
MAFSFDLIHVFSELADLFLRAGGGLWQNDPAISLEAYRRHLEILEFIDQFSTTDQLVYSIASANRGIGLLLMRLNQQTEALNAFRAALSRLPNHVEGVEGGNSRRANLVERLRSDIYLDLGDLLLARGESAAALDSYRSALESEERWVAANPQDGETRQYLIRRMEAVRSGSVPLVDERPPASSFLIFFDWNEAGLTARAQQIAAEAAASARYHNAAVIQIDGHDDLSQSAARAQRISLRRADAVAEALVRLGWPRDHVRIAAFGKTRPLVPTRDGVREPQNRRVEIILRSRADPR